MLTVASFNVLLPPAMQPAYDLLVSNALIWTGNSCCKGAIAIKDNKFSRVLVLDTAEKNCLKQFEEAENALKENSLFYVDCLGGLILPGFNDTHFHYEPPSYVSPWLDASSANTLERLRE